MRCCKSSPFTILIVVLGITVLELTTVFLIQWNSDTLTGKCLDLSTYFLCALALSTVTLRVALTLMRTVAGAAFVILIASLDVLVLVIGLADLSVCSSKIIPYLLFGVLSVVVLFGFPMTVLMVILRILGSNYCRKRRIEKANENEPDASEFRVDFIDIKHTDCVTKRKPRLGMCMLPGRRKRNLKVVNTLYKKTFSKL